MATPLWWPPPWSPRCTICLPHDIFHVKRPQLSENQRIGSITPGSWGGGGDLCKSQTPRVVVIKCFTLSNIWKFDFYQNTMQIIHSLKHMWPRLSTPPKNISLGIKNAHSIKQILCSLSNKTFDFFDFLFYFFLNQLTFLKCAIISCYISIDAEI